MSSQTLNMTQAVQPPAAAVFPCRDLVSIRDLGPSGVEAIFQLAGLMKSRPSDFRGALAGKQMVMFFEKASLRTRLTFEAGMASMGGTTFFVDQTAGRLDAREKLSDIAHNLERWVTNNRSGWAPYYATLPGKGIIVRAGSLDLQFLD